MIRRGARGELDGRDPETPDICFEIITPHLWKQNPIFELYWHVRHRTCTVLTGESVSFSAFIFTSNLQILFGCSIADLLHDLWGHPARRSHKGFAHFVSSHVTTRGKEGADAEV